MTHFYTQGILTTICATALLCTAAPVSASVGGVDISGTTITRRGATLPVHRFFGAADTPPQSQNPQNPENGAPGADGAPGQGGGTVVTGNETEIVHTVNNGPTSSGSNNGGATAGSGGAGAPGQNGGSVSSGETTSRVFVINNSNRAVIDIRIVR